MRKSTTTVLSTASQKIMASRLVLQSGADGVIRTSVANTTMNNAFSTSTAATAALFPRCLSSSGRLHRRSFSSMAVAADNSLPAWEDDLSSSSSSPPPHDPNHRHCNTCTCEDDDVVVTVTTTTNTTATATTEKYESNDGAPLFPCGSPKHEDEFNHLPPPLPEPAYSVHKRILPASLIGLSSPKGREMLLQSLTQNTAESYWALMEQFVNQSDPAFCGITTLLMVLNAMCVDPQVRWRGGWRFYGSEEFLLGRCCLSMERIRRVGVTLEEFRLLARCQGLGVDMKRPFPTDDNEKEVLLKHHHRPSEFKSLDSFRDDIQQILTTPNNKSLLVVSFSRASLEQTGDGHFSPIAAYHEESDQVLVLDVARFKYTPYWVPVSDLYHAMQPKDSATKRSRGWFLLHPPEHHACLHQTQEVRRPAELVPVAGDPDVCPLGRVKVEYCEANPENPRTIRGISREIKRRQKD